MRVCAMCGSRRIRRELISVPLSGGLVVRDVPADVCPACGERFFDPEAMQMIDTARMRPRRRERKGA